MPQASKYLVDKWGGEQGVGEDKAINFLTSKGWKEIKNGMWQRPKDKSEIDVTQDEWEALTFLCDEWDHGYVEN